MARKDKWVWIAIVSVLIITTAYYGRSIDTGLPSSRSTSYSGTKVLYLLLERLGYRMGRIDVPLTRIPRDAKVIVVLSPLSDLKDDERVSLETWIRQGGVLMLSPGLAQGAQGWGDLDEEQTGRGEIVSISSTDAINYSMIDEKIAFKQVKQIEKYARPGDRILFDEYHFALPRGQVRPTPEHVKASLILLAICALVAFYARGRRFGAVRDEPDVSALRPGIEYVNAVGQLYKRAHAPGVAASSLCRTFKRKLCMKLGLPSDAEVDDITEQAEAAGMSKVAEITKVLERCEPGAEQEPIEEPELVRVAREIHDLEEELGIGSG